MDGKERKDSMAILTSDKADLRTRNITTDKEGYHITIKDKFIKKIQ